MNNRRIAFILGIVAFFGFISDANAKKPIKIKPANINKHKPAQIQLKKNIKHAPDISKCDAISKTALHLEQAWKQADERIVQINKRITDIRRDLSKHNEAISKNVDQIMNTRTESSGDAVVISHYSEIANRKYRDMSFKNKELGKLENEYDKHKEEQARLEREIEGLKSQISVHNEEKIASKLVADNITCIVQDTDNVMDLIRRLDYELAAGSLKILPKCKASVPHMYPVEVISSKRTVTCPFEAKYQLINLDVTARPQALVFAPCHGTVVFCKPLKKLGHTMVIHNSECFVVICGFEKEFYSIGNIVSQGQIIGMLGSAQCDKKYASMKYIIRTRLDK